MTDDEIIEDNEIRNISPEVEEGTSEAETTQFPLSTRSDQVGIRLYDTKRVARALTGTEERGLIVKKSPIHGKGLFTTVFIRNEEFIIQYFGEPISRKISLLRQIEYDRLGIDNYFMKVEQGMMIDATIVGNCARFINNSCDPNCISEIITIKEEKVVIIRAKRNIEPGEELTFDYNFISDELVACRCAAEKCRKTLNSNLRQLKLDTSVINQILRAGEGPIVRNNLATKTVQSRGNDSDSENDQSSCSDEETNNCESNDATSERSSDCLEVINLMIDNDKSFMETSINEEVLTNSKTVNYESDDSDIIIL